MIPAEDSVAAGLVHSDAQGGSAVLRILLGSQLQRLRTAKGLSSEKAAQAISMSPSKINGVEQGQLRIRSSEVADLLTLYNVSDPQERATLLALADCANTPSWWQKYDDILPSWFEGYVELEESASVIRTYELQFVPGLLQTEEYARAVIQLNHATSPSTEVEQRISMRMQRQERLFTPDAPRYWAVVDEAALRRPYGHAKVLRDQINYLLEISELPNVTLQVMPFAYGGHSAAGGAFTILRFAAPDLPDIVYLEQLHSAVYLDKRDDTHRYLEIMGQLCVQAPPPAATPGLLTSLRDALG
ncbi:transcriptional regulator with XRE-family HTH domain [Lipingzhangella halophila]|uniref:Transcriptional regulator with XRE-family HTH domain n=1 Tax=Lipingzhangella halophila TaxID=1783352 RepID=A0A7W7RM45_9ACTN|nr:helix-turn-helix transcriptional regulator [Lipingzhangella halophila]MBB4934517.1 transcriptional regulator with XRE-family HTH domain [Lipingzhangella halophila]